MSTLSEVKQRWNATFSRGSTLTHLRDGVKYNAQESPCLVGYRSLCWKIFLLFGDRPAPEWAIVLNEHRSKYSEKRHKFLKYVHNPESLSLTAADPLDDDPKSPWNTVREDESIREEIEQDVRRLPDEPFYQQKHVQNMVSDILFMYCKLHPDQAGYRQGMHELVAPLVMVLSLDAANHDLVSADSPSDATMINILDKKYVEHDAFLLFGRIMRKAAAFYDLGPSPSNVSGNSEKESTKSEALDSSVLVIDPVSDVQQIPSIPHIVLKSKHIHEVCLRKVDPQLAHHLSQFDIPPQIFLIRWIRLLFSREFPLQDLLVFWDTLFAQDPNLELIDWICVAMLIRIHHSLMDGDNSECLTLLLNYPEPSKNHGPQTFIADAIYLKLQMNATAGSHIVEKHTGKPISTSIGSRIRASSSASVSDSTSPRRLWGGARSPLGNSPNPKIQPVSMDSILQGAKGMFERGEKLGINRAVREAVGEIKKNVQQLQEVARNNAIPPMDYRLIDMEKRNHQLSRIVGDIVDSMRELSISGMEDREQSIEAVQMFVARLKIVQISLEDSSISVPIPVDDPPATSAHDGTPRNGSTQISSGNPVTGNSTGEVSGSKEAPETDIEIISKSEIIDMPSTSPSQPHSSFRENQPTTEMGSEMSLEVNTEASGNAGIIRSLPSSVSINADGASLYDPLSPSPRNSTTSIQQTNMAASAKSTIGHSVELDSFSRTQDKDGVNVAIEVKPARQVLPSTSRARTRNAFLFGESVTKSDDNVAQETKELFGTGLVSRNKTKSPDVAHIFGAD